MEKLKVGDKVYRVDTDLRHGLAYYSFATVERLTAKSAILSNGFLVDNIPLHLKGQEFSIFFMDGNGYWWCIVTPEILQQEKLNWFRDKEFTDAEKILIYNFLNDVSII